MALTKVSRGLLSTGIVDNSNATAITLNADESATFAGNVGIGAARTDGTLHVHTGTAGTVAASTQADDIVIENSAEGGMTIITPDDQSARIRFTSPSTNNEVGGAHIFYRQNINKMQIGTAVSGGVLSLASGAGSEAISIDASQRVGIGASSISSWTKLQIAGTAGAQTGATQALYITSPSTTANEGVGIRMSAASGSHEAVGIIGMVNNASGNAGSMTFHTYNGGANIPERMRISAEGYVTTPYQPVFGVSGNVYSAAIFRGGAVHSNVGGHFNTTTGIFTAPVAGTYSFMFNLSTNDTQSHFVDIFINGLSSLGHSLQYGVIYSTGSMAINVTLAALDSVSARKRGSSYATYNATFSGHLIG
jgi:hypothetical protein